MNAQTDDNNRTAVAGPVERQVRPHTGRDASCVCESCVPARLTVFGASPWRGSFLGGGTMRTNGSANAAMKRTPRQHLQEALRLLRVAYRKPRKPDHPYEVGDTATISVRTLHRVEQDLHELWWNQARRGYLRAEIRRRVLAEILACFSTSMLRLRQVCLLRRHEGTPTGQVESQRVSESDTQDARG